MTDPAQLLEAYFRRLLEIRQSSAGVKEESYYDALSNLLSAIGSGLKPHVRCILQLGNRGAGRPDGGLFSEEQWKQGDQHKPLLGLPQPPNRGVIEVKPTSDDAWLTADTKQVTTYWQHYRQVLVTNYRDFVLVGQDQDGNPVKLEAYRLADTEDEFWTQAAHPRAFARRHGATFMEFVHRVMLYATPLATPRDVAWFLASYARTAMGRIEGKELPALAAVRSALEEALGLKFVGDKGEHFFRSTLVQTLFYGVFSAWVLWAKGRPETSKDRFEWRTAVWHLRVPMIQALFSNVATPASLGPLGLVEVLDWTGGVLNRVVRKDFFSAFEEGRAVQYFYEPFLESFDPELRKELGVWYTPPEIVQYTVARVDTVLREELGLPDGLADPNVYVLDPCCGTGSYLVEVLRCIHRTLQKTRGDALVGSEVKAAAQGRVFGFEILPAPFVVSHLQLGLLLQNLGAPLAEGKHERAGVYLTNALTGWEPLDPEKEKAFQAMLKGFPELLEERDSAREVKREKPILVILGNPPYNAFAGVAATEEEQKLVAVYKQGLANNWNIKKFNLDDPYVRFFRMAEHRIVDQTGQGVVCFISNFSHLNDPSFVVMREHFLKEFDRLWFDNMNGDSRETGKRTPEGKPDPSVFSTEYNREGIRVGTAVALLLRKQLRAEKQLVRYRDFWGVTKRADLMNSLKAQDLNESYKLLAPETRTRYSFRPLIASQGYPSWQSAQELAEERPFPAFMESRRGAFINIDKAALEGRMRAYYDKQTDWKTLEKLGTGLTQNAAGFDALKARGKAVKKETFNTGRLLRYSVRPFDTQWCYYTKASTLWHRSRPELWAQCWTDNSFLVTRLKTEKEAKGSPLYFSRCLVDCQCLARNVSVIPIGLRDGHAPKVEGIDAQMQLPGSGMQEHSIRANLSPGARQYLASLGSEDPDHDAYNARIVWMHTLAIGYSPSYLSENSDAIRQDWPRIPLPNTKEALKASAELGEQVAALLDTEHGISGITAGQIREELKPIGIISRQGGGPLQDSELALTAGWGHSQGNMIMPGKGKIVERDYTPEECQAIEAGARKLSMSLDEAFARLGERTCDVYLNDMAFWRNIPKGVWDYVIGGYQVIKKWLSYREQGVLGRPLTTEEAREVTNMARRIAALRLMEPALDANYLHCKSNAFQWAK